MIEPMVLRHFVLLAGVLACSTTCLLELEAQLACGDGHIDRSVGEECEPDRPSSYINACAQPGAQGRARCDEETCQIINTPEVCNWCGNGIIDRERGEECDRGDLDGQACPGGGTLRCDEECRFDRSQCNDCGNGVVETELGEECDFMASGDFASEVPCTTLMGAGRHFESGTSSRCTETCRWDRSSCSFCGDDIVDDAMPLGEGLTTPFEVCDGVAFRESTLENYDWMTYCSAEGPHLRPSVVCNGDCQTFEPPNLDEHPPCCVRPKAPCPETGSSYPCCIEVAGLADADTACTKPGDLGDLTTPRICR